MNVTVENLAPCKKLLRVELDVKKVNETFESVTKQFQRQVSLPGFRPGKAPRDIVVKRFASAIEDEVKDKLTREGYNDAVRDQKLTIVAPPDVEHIQFGKDEPFQIAVTVETAPEFELPEYKGLPVQREKASVTDQDVEKAIDMLRERQTKFDTVTRELRDGDIAVVNFTGTSEGKPITEIAPTARGLTEQKGFWVEVKDTSFIPGFAKQLVGAKAGDKRTVNVDFPDDFVTPQLQGKKGTYEVEVVEVREKILPELNDEFAKSYGAENAEKLREGVRKDLENELKWKQDRDLQDQLVRQLLQKVQVDLPESFVAEETRRAIYNIVNENTRRGVPKEVIDAQKEQIFTTANLNAKDRVKANFIFQKIAEKEKVNVDQKEVVYRVQQLAAQSQTPMEEYVKELQKNDGVRQIYEQLTIEKVLDLLLANAKVEEVEPAPKQA